MVKKDLSKVKQKTNATAKSGLREKVAAAQKSKKTQPQEHAVGKPLEWILRVQMSTRLLWWVFIEPILDYLVEVRPVGQKSKQKSRPAAEMAEKVVLSAKRDLAHGGKVAAESKVSEKHIISKSQKNTTKRLPDISKTTKPASDISCKETRGKDFHWQFG